MRRIIVLLTVAALFAAAMAVSAMSAVADPNCAQVPNNPNCVPTTSTTTTGPGEAENKAGADKNPNVKTSTTTTTTFKPGKG